MSNNKEDTGYNFSITFFLILFSVLTPFKLD